MNYFLDLIERIANKIPESNRQTFEEEIKILFKHFEEFRKPYIPEFNIEEAKKWWQRADKLKMEGFYVDNLNGTWHDPKNFTKEQYLEVEKYTMPVIKNANRIKELFDKSELMKK